MHFVVCETFHGPRPPGHQAAHGNGAPADCRAENLSWKTPHGNQADRLQHGTLGRKLTAEQVSEIRLWQICHNRIARPSRVSAGMISHIRTGRTWLNVPSAC